jgi:hypothetical protein
VVESGFSSGGFRARGDVEHRGVYSEAALRILPRLTALVRLGMVESRFTGLDYGGFSMVSRIEGGLKPMASAALFAGTDVRRAGFRFGLRATAYGGFEDRAILHLAGFDQKVEVDTDIEVREIWELSASAVLHADLGRVRPYVGLVGYHMGLEVTYRLHDGYEGEVEEVHPENTDLVDVDWVLGLTCMLRKGFHVSACTRAGITDDRGYWLSLSYVPRLSDGP